MTRKELSISREEMLVLLECAQLMRQGGARNPVLERLAGLLCGAGDYEILHPLAKGGHSEVFVVKDKATGQVHALKKVEKRHILNDPLMNPVMRERNAMAAGRGTQWLLTLQKAFQDATSLYFLTEFVPGGDLGSICCRHGPLADSAIRFYAGEILMALRELHALGTVHRDIKPENVLVDAEGHIRLADFGSCTPASNNHQAVAHGTPNYVSPESLNMEPSTSEKADLWSLGIVMYEMKFLETPFYENSVRETYRRIMDMDYTVGECSEELKDAIQRLLVRQDERAGVDEMMRHRFFEGFSFEDRTKNTPPFVPEVSYEGDTSNFETDPFVPEKSTAPGESERKHLGSFVGFTYDPEIRVAFESEEPREAARRQEQQRASGEKKCEESSEVEMPAHSEEHKAEDAVKKEAQMAISFEQDTEKEYITASRAEEPLRSAMQEKLQESVCRLAELLEAMPAPEAILKIDSAVAEGSRKERTMRLVLEEEKKRLEETVQRETRACEEKRRELERESGIVLATRRVREEVEYQARRQLRAMQGELRETQARLEREVAERLAARLRAETLETENEQLRDRIRRLKLGLATGKIPVKIHREGRWDSGTLYMAGESIRIKHHELPIDKVYFQEVSRNELHHLGSKGASLAFRLSLPAEVDAASHASSSAESMGRTADALLCTEREQEIRAAIEKETRILDGIRKMAGVLSGPAREDALRQASGSEKKIAELRALLEDQGEVGTGLCTAHRYNNHTFEVSSFGKDPVWCHVCSRLLYGTFNQGVVCRGCRMVCHRECHTLVNCSCELHIALERGTKLFLMCRTPEDKAKIKDLLRNIGS